MTNSIIIHQLQARIDQLSLYQQLSQYCVNTIIQYTRLVKQCSVLNDAVYDGHADAMDGPNSQQSFRLYLKQLKANNITISHDFNTSIKSVKKSLTTLHSSVSSSTSSTSQISSSPATTTTTTISQSSSPPLTPPTATSSDACSNDLKDIEFAFNSNLVKIHQHGPARKFEFKNIIGSIDYMIAMMNDMVLVNDITTSLLSYHTVDSVSAINSLSSPSPSSSSSSSPLLLESVLTIDQLISTSISIHETNPQLIARCYYLTTLYILSPELSQLLWASMYVNGLPHSMIDSDVVSRKWLCENPTSAAWDLLRGE